MKTHAQNEFKFMLTGCIMDSGKNQTLCAAEIGCSPQYLSDLMKGRRLPSVEITNKICKWLACGETIFKKKWHQAAAKAHGWNI